jgi:tetratricopeptide (TPR) repeat protein
MDTDNDHVKGMATLRGSISVLTRGGPFRLNVSQSTDPVLLKGMRLPAEAEYIFKNPVSVELFFGENGFEGQDVSLGVFPIFNFVPAYAPGPENFEIILAVTSTQVLSISLLDHVTKKYRGIGYMDISDLEPPPPVPKPDKPFTGFTKEELQAFVDRTMKAPPRQARLPRSGKDLSQELTISFEEALHGAAKNIQAATTQPCPVCTGSGVKPGKAMVHCLTCEGTGVKKEEYHTDKGPEYHFSTCPDCNCNGLINVFPCQKCKGNGWIRSTRPITLQIPSFIDSGAEICLLHQGEPGRDGGRAGHLRILVHVTAHSLFSRVGRELSIILPVSTDFARQGGRVRVPGTKRGVSYLVDLLAGTKDNSLFRVFDGDDYSLTVCIEIYRTGFQFALPQVNRRLKEIQDRLGEDEVEVPSWLSGGQGRNESETAFKKQVARTWEPPRLAHFYAQRGIHYANKKDRFHAIVDFNKVLELNPAFTMMYDERAALHGLNKDFAKALADIEKALELEPWNAAYLLHKGMIHNYQNDLEKARAAYDRALEIDPACLDAYKLRGRLAAARGDLQAVVADFSRVLEIKPDEDETRGYRGLAYAALKEFDKAIADLDIFVKRHPKNPNGYNNRGHVHLKNNNLEKALGDYDRALELNPKLLPARIYRGKTHILLGQFEKAIEDLNQALTLNPKDPYPLLLLGQAYQGMGEKNKAVAAYQKFLNSSNSLGLSQEARQHLAELGIKVP